MMFDRQSCKEPFYFVFGIGYLPIRIRNLNKIYILESVFEYFFRNVFHIVSVLIQFISDATK